VIPSDYIPLRVALTVFALLLIRRGYSGLRGRAFAVPTRGDPRVFVGGRAARFAGALFVVCAALLLYAALLGGS
jgi:hypothetical protein